MSLSDSDLLELHRLCCGLVDNTLTSSERARLEDFLRASDEARRFYVRSMDLSSSLIQYAGEMQVEAPDAPPSNVIGLARFRWFQALGSLAAAAAIALAFWFGWSRERRTTAETAPAEPEENVARLSAAKDCQWIGAAFHPGDELRRGQAVKLASGFAQLTFDSGAQVTLEGPAELNLDSAWEAALGKGTLKAVVPREAVGFRVSNPSVNVVDLGTEFSMVAEDGGATEVFVLKGSVETTALDSGGHEAKPVVLREKQARRFARAGGSDVRDREKKLEKFMRKIALERFSRPVKYVHWSFDESSGDRAAASVTGFEAVLEGPTNGLVGAHAPGKFGHALRLDGQLAARVPFPGLHERAAHTVALWINVPEDAPLPEAGAIVAWPFGNAGQSITIGWNRNPTEGVLGALRTDAGRASIVGGANLRDGRWHHLAVVVSPKGRPGKGEADLGWQLRQYVDGKLEATSFRHGPKRGRGPESSSAAFEEDVLWIGRTVDDMTGEHFQGMLDELYVADAALTPQEIRYLMWQNQPAPAEIIAAE